MSERVSKELSASAKSLSESRVCFIEEYIDNRWIIVIVVWENKLFAFIFGKLFWDSLLFASKAGQYNMLYSFLANVRLVKKNLPETNALAYFLLLSVMK
jgi:hypothetical protein